MINFLLTLTSSGPYREYCPQSFLYGPGEAKKTSGSILPVQPSHSVNNKKIFAEPEENNCFSIIAR